MSNNIRNRIKKGVTVKFFWKKKTTSNLLGKYNKRKESFELHANLKNNDDNYTTLSCTSSTLQEKGVNSLEESSIGEKKKRRRECTSHLNYTTTPTLRLYHNRDITIEKSVKSTLFYLFFLLSENTYSHVFQILQFT